ncbi:MAG: HDIG domain-containing protein [Bacillota bacterium]|nr:HDIG domain-containing protein [Bacillota bacterium]
MDLFPLTEKHLYEDANPSLFFKSFENFTDFPFSMLERLKGTEQSPLHHPEGSVWNHTMLVIDEAAKRKDKSSESRVFMWAALLHDIGKPDTTRIRNGRYTAYEHEVVGARLAREFLRQYYNNDDDFINKVCAIIRWHMQLLFVVKGLPFADVPEMKREVNVNDIALMGLCDRLGRLDPDEKKEEANIKQFLNLCEEAKV